ncbi:MAG TPA: HD domain-containing phosphohydrolase [Actinomycetota bacterium]|nr:HD domain-containing phosphohydrolase [Actinomycetota bacterium]
MRPCLLIVDDEQVMQVLLTHILRAAGYHHLMTASSVAEARCLLSVHDVDLVLTDMQMPGGSGLELLQHVHETLPGTATLMVTGTDDPDLAEQTLALGSYGYIIKPFRQSEVVIGVSNALRRQALERENRLYRDHLEETVKARTTELWEAVVRLEAAEKSLRASRRETIERLAIAGEFRDEETGSHVARMSRYCEILADGCADAALRGEIREASCLHDVGKIGIPDEILLRAGPLSAEERSTMQTHTEIGHCILRGSDSPLLELAAQIALTHHEKFDGTGYPRRLKGDAIPLAGRIAAIADVFDALTSDRVYRPRFPLLKAIEMMKKETGSHFDPDLLQVFWERLPEVLAVQEERASETHRGPRIGS